MNQYDSPEADIPAAEDSPDPRDGHIIDRLFARSEEGLTLLQTRYGKLCHRIALNLLGNREDAEECVNDAYHKAWNTIPPQKPDSLASYIGMLTRQISLNRYKLNHRQKRGEGTIPLILDELAECVGDGGDMTTADDLALRDALDRFLRELPQRDRMVFLRRYWYADEVARIAADYGMNEGHVGVLLYRTRKKLKEFLEKEEIYL